MTSLQILTGDCRSILPTIESDSVQCVVTSPPYFGLRDYGVDGQIGLEENLTRYVATLVDVFEEVRRVLTATGTLWLNLGDSYAGSWGAQSRQGKTGALAGRSACAARQIASAQKRQSNTGSLNRAPGLKAKDLMGVPWRVAFALQDDGWYLRQDIIWAKPNPMPESVRDRCTKGHEYVFLLSKSERYYFDSEAIKEPCADRGLARVPSGWNGGDDRSDDLVGRFSHKPRTSGNKARKNRKDFGGVDRGQRQAFAVPWTDEGSGRNKRSVWTIPTQPFKGSHFATMPPALVEPCILAGSRTGDTVLDPFSGAGTTGLVANRHGRSFVGIELNPSYVALSRDRIEKDAGFFAEVS